MSVAVSWCDVTCVVAVLGVHSAVPLSAFKGLGSLRFRAFMLCLKDVGLL